MLNKLFTKALSLEVGGQTISFNTIAEVEFALSGRTDVPAKKIAEMVALSLQELRLEAKAIKNVEQQFVEVLSKSIEEPGSITKYKDTVIFDSVIIEQQADKTNEFSRLPKGELLNISLGAGQRINLRFSKHDSQLANDSGNYRIIDDQVRDYPLQDGKNIIGRDSLCNVVVDNIYRDVSRIHLIIEPLDDQKVRFTDLSSHGTFLPHRHVSAALS